MSRSTYIPEAPRPTKPRAQAQPELITDPEPQQVTVDGAGLLEWCRRDAAGEVHIYRTESKKGIYKIHLMWLHGRKLYAQPATRPEHPTGVRTF